MLNNTVIYSITVFNYNTTLVTRKKDFGKEFRNFETPSYYKILLSNRYVNQILHTLLENILKLLKTLKKHKLQDNERGKYIELERLQLNTT
jgi:hypothetical protein